MAMEQNEGVFKLPINITTDGVVKKTLKTADTYVDKNIEITIETPDAELEAKSIGAITATAGTTDTVYTSDTETAFPITITADATVGDVKVGVKTPGFAEASDLVTVAGSSADQATKTIYIKEGSLKSSGTASAEGGNGVNLTNAGSSAPESGFYIKASAAGGASVDTAGWVDPEKTASTTVQGDTYYSIAGAELANAETTGKTYTTKNTPVLISGKGLYINEGYIQNTYIPLADLVPDDATVVAGEGGNSNLIYKTVSVYDKDGTLVAGTMGDATLSDITATDAKATVSTVSVAAKADKSGFTVSGNGAISGTASVSVATTGYATTDLAKSGKVSGDATVDASLAKIGLAAKATKTDVTVTPVISKESSTTAKTENITTTAPTGYYVAVSTAAIANSSTVTPTVATEGYGTADVNSATTTSITAGANGSGTYYIPVTSGTHSLTKADPEITNAAIMASTDIVSSTGATVTGVLSTKPTDGDYITIDTETAITKGSVTTKATCALTEGYMTASNETATITGEVDIKATQAATKYIKIYNGELLD